MKIDHATTWNDNGLLRWGLWADYDEGGSDCIASGSSPDVGQAFEQAKIAWEQHSEDKP